jgi:hypothetical protein
VDAHDGNIKIKAIAKMTIQITIRATGQVNGLTKTRPKRFEIIENTLRMAMAIGFKVSRGAAGGRNNHFPADDLTCLACNSATCLRKS